ncbi:acyl carrier protein [Microlunatus ginsengisoli]
MAEFGKDQLVEAMRAAAGEDESTDLASTVFEASFADLGYDSLAVLEIASRIEREYGIDLPEDTMAGVETPAELVDLVNGQLRAVA